MPLTVVADAAIPGVGEAFAAFGPVRLVAGHAIDRSVLRDADILVVRTVTRVNRDLLEGSRVRFVASPTAGIDHVDTGWLAGAGIGFANAPGCNARPVAEYVLSSLFALAEMRGIDPWTARVGIVGCGQVGSRLMAFLDALGIGYLACDPPLREATGNPVYRDLDALRDVEILTLHVPLTRDGAHPTFHLVDAGFLGSAREDLVLINTSRGGVVDEEALIAHLAGHPRAAAIIDVWEGEPDISEELLGRAAIATPHIAGYSLAARRRGLAAVKRAAEAFFGRPADAPPADAPFPGVAPIRLDLADPREAVRMAVLAGYDVRADAAPLRALAGLPRAERAAAFLALRDRYPPRMEFTDLRLVLPAASPEPERMLGALGFAVTTGFEP